MTASEKIRALSDRFEKQVIAIRRDLHSIPEASFHETRTQARICSYLKRAGIEFKSGAGGTGVVGLIKGSSKQIITIPGGRRPSKPVRRTRTIALRCDMDALNLTERTGLPFASRNKGFMHACGHDAHMAMVLGAGMVLKSFGRDLPGNVKLIFQSAEETLPGGALGMIRDGVLASPEVNAIIGVHVDPAVPAGKVAVNRGVISAAADDFSIKITGKGGHGSSPHVGVDAIAVAAHFLTTLQTVVSRRVSALDNVVVSVGRIAGGERHNIIADAVEMDGTIRTKKPDLREKVPAMIKQILDGTCVAFGAKSEFRYVKGYPGVFCDPRLSEAVRMVCSHEFGAKHVITTLGFEMGGEDFAYYAEKVPGTVVLVGVTNKKKGKIHKLHHAQFDLDEDALKMGVRALAFSALYCLAEISMEAYFERWDERGGYSPAAVPDN